VAGPADDQSSGPEKTVKAEFRLSFNVEPIERREPTVAVTCRPDGRGGLRSGAPESGHSTRSTQSAPRSESNVKPRPGSPRRSSTSLGGENPPATMSSHDPPPKIAPTPTAMSVGLSPSNGSDTHGLPSVSQQGEAVASAPVRTGLARGFHISSPSLPDASAYFRSFPPLLSARRPHIRPGNRKSDLRIPLLEFLIKNIEGLLDLGEIANQGPRLHGLALAGYGCGALATQLLPVIDKDRIFEPGPNRSNRSHLPPPQQPSGMSHPRSKLPPP
jgi:hypothetical protein